MRTTVDIDDPILKEVKRLGSAEKKSLGRVISELLALALRERRPTSPKERPLRWVSRQMRARVDLNDKEALYAEMDRGTRTRRGGRA